MSGVQGHVDARLGRMNPLAVASIAFSLAWLGGVGAVMGVICGHVARRQISHDEPRQQGAGIALAGLVLGWAGLLFALFAWVAILPIRTS